MDEKRFNSEEKPILRDEKGLFLKGTAAGPGRPMGSTLKEYQAQKFREMSDEEKEQFLKDITKDTRWRMAEGNPQQNLGGDPSNPLIVRVTKEGADKYGIINTQPESDIQK